MKKTLFFLKLALFSTVLSAQNYAPNILDFNLSVSGSSLTIDFSLEDKEQDSCFLVLIVRDSNNEQVSASNATGDVFKKIAVGSGKSISWDFEGLNKLNGEHTIRLVAFDFKGLQIPELVAEVDSTRLYEDLVLVEGIRHRITDSMHLEEVRNLIKDRFSANGLDLEIQTFSLGSYIGKNYVATIPGTESDELYILCAHYDSVDDSPGADDNGSGIVGLLETARLLAPYHFRKTIKLIAFDLEEEGLNGSIDFVNNHIGDDVVGGVLDFEMIGYATEEPNTQVFPTGFEILYPEVVSAVEADGNKGNFIANVGRVGQNDWELRFVEYAGIYVPELKVVTFNAPVNWPEVTPDLGRSDHAPFWASNYPAVMLTGTANFRNTNYHTKNDTIGSLNFTFMANVIKASIATLAESGQMHHSADVVGVVDLVLANETDPINSINIFPNPAKNILFVESNSSAIKRIDIYDSKGQLALSKKEPNRAIDISILNNGMYQVKLQVGDTQLVKQVVIDRY